MSIDLYKQKILSFYSEKRRMPSYTEIMDLVGFKSKNAVFKLVNKLVELGILEKDAQGRLSPMRLSSEVPVLGLVEAGIPTTIDPMTLDTLSLDQYLVRDTQKTFLLEVKGDSMIEEGIMEGDMVLAERITREPKEGEIVIAEVDGAWTMKYFRKKNGKVFLEPANKNYKPIYPEYDLKISAVVRGVIRKY